MLDRDFEREIARQLGDGRSPDDLIVFVCERTGLQWDAARQEILRVRGTYRENITRRRTWVLFAVWIPTLIAGSVVTISALIMFLVDPVGFTTSLLRDPLYAIAAVGGGLCAFGGSMMVFFGKKKPPKS
ncbi:MAG TPA: hypothetical protein VLZ30_01150 [Verrucomicrobiae bacterium]|nr:hypothetical protein [Verrucomicrobiae bacterium]